MCDDPLFPIYRILGFCVICNIDNQRVLGRASFTYYASSNPLLFALIYLSIQFMLAVRRRIRRRLTKKVTKRATPRFLAKSPVRGLQLTSYMRLTLVYVVYVFLWHRCYRWDAR